MSEQIVGHEEIVGFFEKAIKNAGLSHAYCFVGPENVGKKTVSRFVASKILETEEKRLKVNPDYVFLDRVNDAKTGKLKKDISILQVRNLISSLSQKSFKANGYKIAVVEGTENMSLAAANALLKTLEEPKPNTIIILLTKDDARLLGTVRSRCQMIYFNRVPNVKVAQMLKDRGLDEMKAGEYARKSMGLPGLALRWNDDEEEFDFYKKEEERFSSMLGRPFFEKLQIVDELFGDKTDHILARGRLSKILNIWQIFVHDHVCDSCDLSKHFVGSGKSDLKDVSVECLVKIQEEILQAKRLLDKNVHPRLLVENILLLLP